MRFTGRMVAIGAVLFFHFSLMYYYFYRDGVIEIVDILSTPIMLIFAYWAGKCYDQAKFYSEKDVLTGLYNRRSVENSFEKVASLADRARNKLFILVIDCDNFKEINDIYGHQYGDIVLTKISAALVSTMRKCDIVVRWGGDEFLVIGQYKEETDLQIVHQRLEEELQSLSKQLGTPIIASIGMAIFPDQSKDLFELIKIADDNMYNNKRGKK